MHEYTNRFPELVVTYLKAEKIYKDLYKFLN